MSAQRSQIRAHTLAYLCLATLFLLSVTAIARDMFDSIDQMRHGREYARPPFYLGDANWGAVVLRRSAVDLRIGFVAGWIVDSSAKPTKRTLF